MTGVRKAVGYVRVSQVGGRTGDTFLSPEVQRERIEAWAAYRQHEIVGWYTDLDVSGRRGVRRPEFERMMADARAGAFDTIAVYRLTRFGRSVLDTAARYSELEEAGVDLASATEDIDTTTAGGKLLRTILFALAEFESERIGEEWRNVHATRRRRGLANVTRPMLGYQLNGGTIGPVIEEEAAAVRSMYQHRERGLGHIAIATRLQEEGHRPKQGGDRFPVASIREVLANPHYAGLVRAGDDLVDGQHQAIVTVEQYERVQAATRRAARLGRNRAALLSGLVVCSSCGQRLSVQTKQKQERRWRVYACRSNHIRAHTCGRPVQIKAEHAEQVVASRFLRALQRAARRLDDRGRIRPSAARRRGREAKRARLEARAAELRRAIDRLADQRYIAGSLDQAEHDRQFRRYVADYEKVLAELDELPPETNVTDLPLDLVQAWPLVDTETRRDALRLAIERIIILPPARSGKGLDPAHRVKIEWR